MFKTIPISHAPHPMHTESRGYCKKCDTIHRLESSEAKTHCLSLMEQLDKHHSIDFLSGAPDKIDRLKTEYLFGPAKGKMFGVMHCLEPDGTTLQIRAFSGQYNGLWEVEGWVPPLFEVDVFSSISDKIEKQIKAIGREIDLSLPHSAKWLLLRKKRRKLSQDLMRDIHSLYRITNFRGETAPLYQAYTGQNGIPTGTGDCCGPKLLNYAAKNNLVPLSLAEFYWGLENKSGSRQHGSFYSSCEEKCAPILGFMLCGIEHRDNRYITT